MNAKVVIRPSLANAHLVRYIKNETLLQQEDNLGSGGGLVVSVLAFYSDDPSLIPAEVYIFSVKLLLKSTKINKKEAGLAHFFKKTLLSFFKVGERMKSHLISWLIFNIDFI